MTTRTAKSGIAEEVAAIEELIGDLEKRLRRLAAGAHREATGAGGDISDFVSEALQRITSRVRDSASEAGKSFTDEAVKLGSGTVQKLTDEIEQRPLLMIAAAAGLGFLAGLANRR